MERKPMKVTIVGAGSTRTPALIGSIIKLKERFPVKKLVFYDIDMDRVEKMRVYMELMMKTHSPETELIFTGNKDEAYKDIDFVFCQMRVGGSEYRSYDEKIPLKYGIIGQETCGPGGFAYGMRSIGDMIEMVNDVRKFSKETWVLDYTNPAAIVGLALQTVFPDDKRLMSICDQPYSMLKTFSQILNVPQKDLKPRYFGLNHFGWFTNLYYEGKDLLPELKDYIKNNDFKPYNAEQRDKSWLDTYLNVNKMMKYFDDYVPNTYLQYYFFGNELAKEENPEFTRVDEAKVGREKKVYDICKKAEEQGNLDNLPFLVGEVHGNMMVEIAESIAYNLENEFVLMMKNDGIIKNLDENMLVEVGSRLGKDGPIPYGYEKIDDFYKALIDNQYIYEKLTVEACLEGNYRKALQALTLNRTVINPEKAALILEDMIKVNKKYWELK